MADTLELTNTTPAPAVEAPQTEAPATTGKPFDLSVNASDHFERARAKTESQGKEDKGQASPPAPTKEAPESVAPSTEVVAPKGEAPQATATTPTHPDTATPTATTDTPDWKAEAEKAKAQLQQYEQARKQAEIQQLTEKQKGELNYLAGLVNQQESLYAAKYRQWQETDADIDPELKQALQQELWVLNDGLAVHRQTLDARAKYFRAEYSNRQLGEVRTVIDATLKERGLTVDDLKAKNPKLDIANPFTVIAAGIDAGMAKIEATYQAKIAELEKKVADAEASAAKAREEWGQTAAGAQPMRTTTGKGAGKAVFDPYDETPASEYFSRARAKANRR